VAEQIKGVGSRYTCIYCLKKIIPSLEKPETYGLFIAGYEICSLRLHIKI
jgi:hypothetical protein